MLWFYHWPGNPTVVRVYSSIGNGFANVMLQSVMIFVNVAPEFGGYKLLQSVQYCLPHLPTRTHVISGKWSTI